MVFVSRYPPFVCFQHVVLFMKLHELRSHVVVKLHRLIKLRRYQGCVVIKAVSVIKSCVGYQSCVIVKAVSFPCQLQVDSSAKLELRTPARDITGRVARELGRKDCHPATCERRPTHGKRTTPRLIRAAAPPLGSGQTPRNSSCGLGGRLLLLVSVNALATALEMGIEF
jgi:hypothetical protein